MKTLALKINIDEKKMSLKINIIENNDTEN